MKLYRFPRSLYFVFVYFVFSNVRISAAAPLEVSTEIISRDKSSVDSSDGNTSTRLRILEYKLVHIETVLETLSNQLELHNNRSEVLCQKQPRNETQPMILRNIVRSLANGQFNVTKELLEENADTSQISEIIYRLVLSEKNDNASARVLQFEKCLSNASLSYVLLKSLWKEIRITGQIHPSNLIDLLVQFEALPPELSDTHRDNRSAISDDMKNMLNVQTHNIISKYLTNQASTPSEEISSLCESFQNHNFEKEFHQIMTNAVNAAGNTTDAADILKQIKKLSNHSISDKILVTAAVSALFWKTKENNLLTDQLTVDILKILDPVKHETDQFTADELQKVLDSIPTCLRNLVHKKRVGIRNIATKEILDYGYHNHDAIGLRKHSFATWDVEMTNMHVEFTSQELCLDSTHSDFKITYLRKCAVNSPTTEPSLDYDYDYHRRKPPYQVTPIYPSLSQEFTIQSHGQYCSISIAGQNKFMFASGIHMSDSDVFVFFGYNNDVANDRRYLWEFY